MKIFKTEFKVRTYECDLYGHVNNAVYLNYFEAARVEFLETIDLNLAKLKEIGFLLPIVRIEIDYKRPLFPGDIIEVTAEWVKRGVSSSIFKQNVIKKKTQELAASALVTWVATDLKGKPVPIPEVILENAKGYFGTLPNLGK
ncbi:acyl-CoA thioesterase [candidate division KSB1 bacterium]|nr:MAG: acyl-CoA thioesterase [candidate division KSB1 bacterium]